MASPSRVAIEETAVYQTRFLGQAAFLDFQGHIRQDMVWEDGMFTFYFEDTPSLREDVRRYEAGEAKVDPFRYYQKVIGFKRMVYEKRPTD
jgi:hypothetical protein